MADGRGGEERTDWVVWGKVELEAVDLVHVDWIRVHDLDVHEPDLEIVCRDERDAWGEGALELVLSVVKSMVLY